MNTLWSFSHQHPSFLHLMPSYNHRVFTQLGELRNVINLLMHTPKSFQGVCKYAQVHLHLETWRYMARSLEEGDGGLEQPFMKKRDKLVSQRRF